MDAYGHCFYLESGVVNGISSSLLDFCFPLRRFRSIGKEVGFDIRV